MRLFSQLKPWQNVLVILALISFLAVPAWLLVLYLDLFPKSYGLELDPRREIITRYVFDKKASGSEALSLAAKENRNLGEKNIPQYPMEQYYENIIEQYEIDESFQSAESIYNENLNIREDRELNELSSRESGSSQAPVLGDKQSEIIGDMRDMEILRRFDDSSISGEDQKGFQDKQADKVAKNFDNSEIETFINNDKLNNMMRDPKTMRVYSPNKFFTSPIPDTKKVNSDNDLKGLKLLVGKDKYYRFEIVRFNLISKNRININDFKVYVTRDKYIIPNVGGRSDAILKYRDNMIYGSTALGYNPSPGKYKIVVKSKSDPNWEGMEEEFELVWRTVPKSQKGFSIVNMEYTVPFKYLNFLGPDGKVGKYHNLAEWMKYMDADAFWMLVAQTTGWDNSITDERPWVKGGFDNLELVGPLMESNDIQLGAYVMSYFTPANGKKRAGYDPSLGYDSRENKLEDSLHISLNCEKRFQDILTAVKSFQANPYVDYIGLDFIRTGRADGYEMGPLVVDDLNIPTPQGYARYSYTEKVKWFANLIENKKDANAISKWRWWRAHKVASIVNRLITEGQISKPMWVFTLGWKHGQQHGQDPYMFYDAGVLFDAVMLYEASIAQFNNMMIHWPNYMRYSGNNMVIGNSADVRLLDGRSDHPAIEYAYRSKRGYREIYREGQGLAKGIFMHDLSRALWSSKRGLTTLEWALVHGTMTSDYRHELGMIPYQGQVSFNPDEKTGIIEIENKSDEVIRDLEINFVPTAAWASVKDNVPHRFGLAPGEKKVFQFQATVRSEYRNKKPVFGYYLEHHQYRRSFFYTVNNLNELEPYWFAYHQP